MRAVVVTGASTGIGRATVAVLAARGVTVFASVRRDEDARSLEAEHGPAVVPIRFDVTDHPAIRAAADLVRARLGGNRLSGLVNNAGIAVPGPLMELSIDEFRRQLEINLVGQLAVLQAFTPLLGMDSTLAGPPGRIVNITSVAGKRAVPFLGAYAASKHALEAMSESLRRELLPFGVDVIVIGPGAVATPIWDKAEAIDMARFAASPHRAALLRLKEMMVTEGRRSDPPERVALAVWHALTTRRPRTRYAVVYRRLFNWTVPGLLPPRLLDRLIARTLGMTMAAR